MKEGLFWIITQGGDSLQTKFRIVAVYNVTASHAEVWKTIVRHNPDWADYKYYHFPHGKVRINGGQATIFLNRAINTPLLVKSIADKFYLGNDYIVYEEN